MVAEKALEIGNRVFPPAACGGGGETQEDDQMDAGKGCSQAERQPVAYSLNAIGLDNESVIIGAVEASGMVVHLCAGTNGAQKGHVSTVKTVFHTPHLISGVPWSRGSLTAVIGADPIILHTEEGSMNRRKVGGVSEARHTAPNARPLRPDLGARGRSW